jgi:perosamine synthetase
VVERQERVALARPVLGEREEELVLEVLRSGRLSLGPMLGRFERAFAEWLGVPDAVALSSGTAALHLGVRELGWSEGEEVVTTPLSFVASSNCLLYEGAVPRFCDVDPVTLCLDPDAAEEAIGPRTAGILPVHIFGFPAAVERLERIAATAGASVLEDCAQALGTVCADGALAGARGNPAAFAFYANKQLTTGEGGVLVPADARGAAAARSERNQGRTAGMEHMDHARLGFNYRLTDIGAALGIAQLERLTGMLADRRRIAAAYDERLAAVGGARAGEGDPAGLVLPAAEQGQQRRSHFVYIAQVPRSADRDAVIAELDRAGVDARPYLPCIHTQPLYRELFGFRGGEFPVAEEFSRRAVALPFHPALTEAEVERVAGALAAALGRSAGPT